MKVAIIGGSPSSRDLAPYGDPSWQIWSGTPSNVGHLPRADVWFELHPLAFLLQRRNQYWAAPYLTFLRMQLKVYMQGENSVVPNAERFPKGELLSEFGQDLPFYTSSIAWMLALAIYQKVEEIGIFGVDMMGGSEYEYQRPGCQYWVKLARDRGIRVGIPPQSDLNATVPQYGYGDNHPIAIKMMEHAHELRARIAEADRQIAALGKTRRQLIASRNCLQGGLEHNVHTRRTWFAWSGPDRDDEDF